MRPLPTEHPLVRFALALSLGALVGVAYGWIVQPVEFVETAPDSLRRDFRTDYVLMVAEAYSEGQDIEQAQRRLAALGPESPASIASDALDYALAQDFSPPDIERLQRLLEDLEQASVTPEIGGP